MARRFLLVVLVALLVHPGVSAEEVKLHVRLLALTEGGMKRLGRPSHAQPCFVLPPAATRREILDFNHYSSPTPYEGAPKFSPHFYSSSRSSYVIESTVDFLLMTGDARRIVDCLCAVESGSRVRYWFQDLIRATTNSGKEVPARVGKCYGFEPQLKPDGYCIVDFQVENSHVEAPYIVEQFLRTTLRVKLGDTIVGSLEESEFVLAYARSHSDNSLYVPEEGEALVLLVTVGTAPETTVVP